MKIVFLGIAVGALSMAASALATDVSQPPTKPKKERRICKTHIRSGSHLSTTVCKTNAEWLALEGNYDSESEVGVPGNRSATGRSVDVGAKAPTMGKPK